VGFVLVALGFSDARPSTLLVALIVGVTVQVLHLRQQGKLSTVRQRDASQV
jgi:hypothetical protein